MKRWILLALLGSAAQAQVLPPPALLTSTLVPDQLWVQTDNLPLNFVIPASSNLTRTPWLQLDRPGGVLPLKVLSRLTKPWSVLLQVEVKSDDHPNVQVSPDHLRYRINSGEWLEVSGQPEILYSDFSVTNDWEVLQLELQLQFDDRMPAGRYHLELQYSALVLP